MKNGHLYLTRILKAFRQAYRSKPEVQLDEAWQSDVMRAVRTIGVRYQKIHMGFDRFVWRLSPAVIVLILLLGICAARMEFIPGYELAGLFFKDPTNYLLMQSVGIM